MLGFLHAAFSESGFVKRIFPSSALTDHAPSHPPSSDQIDTRGDRWGAGVMTGEAVDGCGCGGGVWRLVWAWGRCVVGCEGV